MNDPLDAAPTPGRQGKSVGWASLMLLEATSVMCGEGFLNHEEHQQIVDVAEAAAKRWLEQKKTLEELDFEP